MVVWPPMTTYLVVVQAEDTTLCTPPPPIEVNTSTSSPPEPAPPPRETTCLKPRSPPSRDEPGEESGSPRYATPVGRATSVSGGMAVPVPEAASSSTLAHLSVKIKAIDRVCVAVVVVVGAAAFDGVDLQEASEGGEVEAHAHEHDAGEGVGLALLLAQPAVAGARSGSWDAELGGVEGRQGCGGGRGRGWRWRRCRRGGWPAAASCRSPSLGRRPGRRRRRRCCGSTRWPRRSRRPKRGCRCRCRSGWCGCRRRRRCRCVPGAAGPGRASRCGWWRPG